MKNCFLLIMSFVLLHVTGNAQNSTVKGFVKDSVTGVALESATVSIFKKDSSLINYQLTDAYGGFSIGQLPLNTEVLLNVTYVGFKPYNKPLKLDSSSFNTTILLTPSFDDSSNVTVTAHIPIRMNGDTLEINPAAFKMDPNAVVEDLLTMVPGVTVWADGSITMNGRKIPSVLVDGKPFMGENDARLATQNLPKDAIDKIQVYQEVDRSLKPEERRKTDSLLTMNIKLKENKKNGYFGKVGLGYGTTDRFESDLSFQMYNKKTSFGVGGGYNNINKNINNLKEMFQNNTYRNYNPNLRNVGNFGTEGINKNHSFGGVFTHNFIETTNSRQNDRITVNYSKSGSDRYLTNQTFQNRTTEGRSQFIEDNSVTNSSGDSHSAGVNYIKTNSYNDNFNINGNTSFNSGSNNSVRTTEVKDSLGNRVSINDVNNRGTNKSNNQSLSASYSKYNSDNPLAQFNVSVNVNNSDNESNRYVTSVFKSLVKSEDDTTYNRNYYNTSSNLSANANIGYNGLKRLLFGRFNFFGIDLSLNQAIRYAKTDRDDRVSDFDTLSGIFKANTRLTNNNSNRILEYTPSLAFSKSIYKWGETFSRNLYGTISINEEFKQDNNSSSFAIRNLNRSFNFLTYNASVYYNYNKRENFSYNLGLYYNKDYNYATVDQLYTITDDVDVFNVRIGNPYLKNKVNNSYNFSGRFNSQKSKAKYAFNGEFNAGYDKSLNPVTDSVINDPSGKRTYYYINAPKSEAFDLSYSLNIARSLKKSKLQLMYSGSFNNNVNPTYIDNIYSETQTLNITNNINLQLALKSLVILNIGKSINNYRTNQSGSGLRSFKNYSDITKFGLTLNLPKSFMINSTLDYTKNSNIEKPVVLWNAFASRRFLKSEQGELKFSAMDILKQFQNIRNSADSYGTTTRISNGLQQYFMLTFSYYPRKFGKTEVKRREVKEEW
ncbi:carboxypeptidase regulatory-like domain-containing protein [Niabella sp. 22666]|uniref:carboxypeptidase regulatory-like domain-containing protein n=1 Tax=Niabella sp. 22666 TaxID=3453954 RepID=UPI003F834B4C